MSDVRSADADAPQAPAAPGRLRDYIACARLDHVTKHVFVVPGIVLALLLRGVHAAPVWPQVLLGFLTALFVASANYVINEFLDRDFDRVHPTKFARAAVQRVLRPGWVALEWALLAAAGLACAAASSPVMLGTAIVFALQGLAYNVPPLRTKDKPYLDVVSESINNPLRLMLGWAMIDPTTLPPSSVILAYWLGGAFLMAAKRLSEYREIAGAHGKELLVRYRASFAGYTEVSLTVSCLVYALLSGFFLAIFLVKYRIEYLLILPVVTALFAHYLALSMQPDSSAQKPERLYRERGLIGLVLALVLVFAVATVVRMPLLDELTAQRFIQLR